MKRQVKRAVRIVAFNGIATFRSSMIAISYFGASGRATKRDRVRANQCAVGVERKAAGGLVNDYHISLRIGWKGLNGGIRPQQAARDQCYSSQKSYEGFRH